MYFLFIRTSKIFHSSVTESKKILYQLNSQFFFSFRYPNKTWVQVSVSVYMNLTVQTVSDYFFALPHYNPNCTFGSSMYLNVQVYRWLSLFFLLSCLISLKQFLKFFGENLFLGLNYFIIMANSFNHLLKYKLPADFKY